MSLVFEDNFVKSGDDLELVLEISEDCLWNGLASEVDFVFSLEKLEEFLSDCSDLLELLDLPCSVLDDEPSLIKSDLDEPDEPSLVKSDLDEPDEPSLVKSDLDEPSLDKSDLEEPDELSLVKSDLWEPDELSLAKSGLDEPAEPSFVNSGLDDPEEPSFVKSDPDLELDFDWSDLDDPDLEWPDRLAARLARPLRGLAAPCEVVSFSEEVDWKINVKKKIKVEFQKSKRTFKMIDKKVITVLCANFFSKDPFCLSKQ